MQNTKGKLFSCEHPGCSKVYSSMFSLKRHQGTHRTDKPFVCDICGKRFVMIQYLKEHSYCHTKEKSHVCKINGCKKSFRHASDLSLHRRVHPEFKLRKYNYLKDESNPLKNKQQDKKLIITNNPSQNIKLDEYHIKIVNPDYFKELSKSLAETSNISSSDDTFQGYLSYLLSIIEGKDIIERRKLPIPHMILI